MFQSHGYYNGWTELANHIIPLTTTDLMISTHSLCFMLTTTTTSKLSETLVWVVFAYHIHKQLFFFFLLICLLPTF
ncbi:hypothetical protein QBC38DRAFT_27916 [Podospora fimiseda]|uniref:Uncharacterized protein n=1 Tax=Podospora fimiseda TaxID=252190 RepID=A0AAN7H6Q7_9PEZI|nr:hypothetical protein QBC38DRAFT_27916 [Podospora fimiseda]